ncbi:MAG TPA: hypothetical protein VJX66_10940, partial [Amycolatopsis sp.]|nr:hypothetical protein [Amycolatopsis sp.]
MIRRRGEGSASSAETRRGSGPPVAAIANGVSERPASAALATAFATRVRFPTRFAAASSAQRSSANRAADP